MTPEPIAKQSSSLASLVSRAVIWNTIFVPIRLVAEVVANLVRLNLLSQASYGLLALVSGASSGIGTGVDLGTTRALPKYIPETNNAGGPRAVLRLLTAVFGAQVGVLLLLSGWLFVVQGAYLADLRSQVSSDPRLQADAQALLLNFLNDYSWLLLAAILAMVFLGICYDMLMAYLNSFFKQRAWNSVALAAGLLPPLLSAGAIITLPAQWDIVGVLAAMVLAPTLAVALAGWQVLRLWQSQDQRALHSQQSTAERQSLFAGAWLPPGFVRYSAVSFLMTMTDFIASPRFAIFQVVSGGLGSVALLWAGASVVQMVLSYLYTPMVGVQVPLFTRVRAGEGGTLLGAYQSLIRLQVLLLVPGGVGLMLLAQQVVVVISPADYLGAVPLVWVLVPCLFLECLLTTAHNALIVYERLRIIVLSRLLTLLVVVTLTLLLTPTLGVLGMALAFGLARVAAGLWVTTNGYRLLGLRWPWRFTLRVVLASAAMALLILGLRELLPAIPLQPTLTDRLREAGALLLLAAVGAGGFLAVLRLSGGLEAQDREQLARLRLPLKRWLLRML